MKKKVLLVSNNGQGFYNFKKELIERLMKSGVEVHFAVPQYEKLVELVNLGAIYHELYIDRRGMNPVKDLGFLFQLIRLFKKVNPNLIILHTIKPNIYGSTIAKWMGTPYINNITGLGSALQVEGKLAKILKMMYRSSLNKSGAIFFENEGNCDYFMRNHIGETNQYVVVPGAGVNTSFYNSLNYGAANTQNLTGRVRFIFIARVMRDKGIEEYLQAAQEIKLKYPEAVFQILGYYDEECYKIQVEKLAQDGIIEYLGVSTDTRVQMSQADCIVLPSYHEGMSNVLLEGASFQLPLIATNVHGCKEAVDNGITGYLCEPKDVESLTAAMERFLAQTPEERKAMGVRGREKMLREFDRQIVIDQYMARIKALI